MRKTVQPRLTVETRSSPFQFLMSHIAQPQLQQPYRTKPEQKVNSMYIVMAPKRYFSAIVHCSELVSSYVHIVRNRFPTCQMETTPCLVLHVAEGLTKEMQKKDEIPVAETPTLVQLQAYYAFKFTFKPHCIMSSPWRPRLHPLLPDLHEPHNRCRSWLMATAYSQTFSLGLLPFLSPPFPPLPSYLILSLPNPAMGLGALCAPQQLVRGANAFWGHFEAIKRFCHGGNVF